MPVNMKGKVHPKMKNNLVDGNQVSETRIRPVWSHLINFSFFFFFLHGKTSPQPCQLFSKMLPRSFVVNLLKCSMDNETLLDFPSVWGRGVNE